MAAPEPTPENITQELYKRNVELAIKNKTLSLLDKLYEISILLLEPLTLAERITQAIQTELDFDLVGLFHYDDIGDKLTTLHFAKSKRLQEVLSDTNKDFDSLKISEVSKHALFGRVFSGSKITYTEDLTQIWDNVIPKNKLEIAKEKAHVRTVILYPLVIRSQKILGVVIIGLNRPYDDLGEFEQEAIRNFVNVIAIALDRTLIYKELQNLTAELATANEELKRLDKAKSEFVSIASHQLRTPLTASKGYVSLVLDGTYGPIDEKFKKPLRNVYESNERLIRLVNDLLSLSRIESGKMKLEREPADIVEIVKSVIDELQIKAEQGGLKLILEKPVSAIPQVRLDKEKIRNVVLNLIDNAIRYTKEGSIRVKLEIRNPKSENQRLFISVIDTGEGMTKEEITKLFQSFSRGQAGAKLSAEGAGLGLYIARQFVEMHNGKIWADSDGKGKGSTFHVELPIQ